MRKLKKFEKIWKKKFGKIRKNEKKLKKNEKNWKKLKKSNKLLTIFLYRFCIRGEGGQDSAKKYRTIFEWALTCKHGPFSDPFGRRWGRPGVAKSSLGRGAQPRRSPAAEEGARGSAQVGHTKNIFCLPSIVGFLDREPGRWCSTPSGAKATSGVGGRILFC